MTRSAAAAVDPGVTAMVEQILAELAGRWGLADLERRVTVRFSARMTRNFGTAIPPEGRITLATRLVGAPEVLREVLIHEAAHVAAHVLHGQVQSHGDEWRALMRVAGVEPRRTMPPLPGDAPGRRRATRWYLHRCPRCRAHRVGLRVVRQWRCVACREAGFDGALDIYRRAGPDVPAF